ncbi:hypothetical protein [Gilvimarinus sp. DA14]|uniref:hypothetical protein n=1 Tax=Gilvimarinus sp. DA14 TaxID=2956798 RepID=UPI0020B6CAAE|nr:hypothetical protein [Gilvimarinus sp. DA14]UTF60489.1 hypothetical protein NHM04_01455 [Gilvimarinus sp. DA14]
MFRLVFAGELLTGFDQESVERNLARLLNQDEQKIRARLFSGEPVTVKKVETQQEAFKWRKGFANAGAVLVVLSLGDTPPANPVVDERDGTLPDEPIGNQGGEEPQQVDIKDPQATSYEEPTLDSEAKRSPGVRMRNKIYVLLGTAALAFVALVVLVLWSTKGLWQGVELEQNQQDLGSALLRENTHALARTELPKARELAIVAAQEGAKLGV